MAKGRRKIGPVLYKGKLFIFENEDDEQLTWKVTLNSVDHPFAYYMRDRATNMVERDQVKTWLEANAGAFGSALTVMTDRITLRHNLMGRSIDRDQDIIYSEFLFNDIEVARRFVNEFSDLGHRVKMTRDQIADPAIFNEIRKTLPFDVDEWTIHYGEKRGYELVLRDPRVATMIKLAWVNSES